MTRCLTVGSATQDTIAIIENKSLSYATAEIKNHVIGWKEGSKIEIEKLLVKEGGGAINSALCLSSLQHAVSCHFAIGQDLVGKTILATLAQDSIQTFPLKIETAPSGTAFVIPIPKHDRLILYHQGANSFLSQKTFPSKLIETHDFLYISPLHGNALSLVPWLSFEFKKQHDSTTLRIAYNPSIEHVVSTTFKGILPSIDLLILNQEEMILCMAHLVSRFFVSSKKGIFSHGPLLTQKIFSYQKMTFTLYEFCKEILSYGIKRILVTDGAQGAYAITKDTLYYHPALPTPITNTLGAGDVFGSTFFSFIIEGKKIEDALRAATIHAASTIQHHGIREGLLTKKQLEKKITTLDTSLLYTTDFR